MYRKFLKTTGIVLSIAMIFAASPVNAFAKTPSEIPSNAFWGKTVSGEKSPAQILAGITKNENQETYSPNQTVDIIVELNDTLQSNPRKNRVRMDAHDEVKQEITALAGGVRGKTTNQVHAGGSDSEFQFMHDYYTVLNGFSVKTKHRYLSQISNLQGVKRAFVAPVYQMEPRVESTPSGTNYLEDSASILKLSGAYEKGYKGQGMTIAVLDTGLDVNHEVFRDFEDAGVTGKLTQTDIANKIQQLTANQDSNGNLTAQNVYHSKKIPFAYDYADKDTNPVPPDLPQDNSHGTHVSGIAAASGDKLQGVAPDAQVCMMKVFSDDPDKPGASDENLFAGLEDAVTLNVDVINMSLGSGSGFSSASTAAEKEVYNNVKAAGINLVISAGNDYSSAYHNQSGYDLPYATSPDSGVVGTPSTFDAGISVASSLGNKVCYNYFVLNDGTKVDFSDSSSSSDKKLYDLSSSPLPYVDCGLGLPDDFSKTDDTYDVSGKIALVQRGSITFVQKAKNAHDAGAIAIIIYNNGPGGLINIVTDPDLIKTMPDVFISEEDGEKMTAATVKTITADPSYLEYSDQVGAGEMSDFSSWGVTPDLKLKPEITAPGQMIYSSFIGGGYGNMQGTSMAAPQITGSEALIRQYVTTHLHKTGVEAENLTHTLLMCTAHPILDPDSATGSYYSPRKEGAGIADVGAAVNTPAYLSVAGETRPKAELGYNTDGVYHFSCTVKNITSSALTYDLDTAALSEEVGSEDDTNQLFLLQHSSDYADNGIDVSYSGDNVSGSTVTVPENGTSTIQVSLRLSESLKQQFDADTPNGTFVDGFVMFQSEDDVPVLSFPYVGFYGDWAAEPVFDSMAAGFDETAAGGPVYATVNGLSATTGDYQMSACLAYDNNTGLPYGTNPLDLLLDRSGVHQIDNSRIAVSPNGLQDTAGDPLFSALTTSTGLLRGAKSLTYTVTDQNGRTIDSIREQNARKTYYSGSNGFSLFAELLNDRVPVFDGKNPNGEELPEGIYTLSETAEPAGTNANQTTAGPVYTIAYDKTAPEIINAMALSFGGNNYLIVKATDNFYLSGMILGNQYAPFDGTDETTELDGSKSCTAVFDLAGISDSDLLTVYDNAMNSYSVSVNDLLSHR